MKSVFITGASQGLGLALSEYYSKRGYFVYAGGFSKDAPLFGPGRSVRCDLTDEDAVRKVFSEMEHLDVLINNARFCPSPRPEGVSDGEWFDRNIAGSLKSSYLCSCCAMELMKRQQGGAIVNISSIRAVIPNDPDRIPYGAAKAGQINLTHSFAIEGAPFGVRVNALLPGVIGTENLLKRVSAEKLQLILNRIPLRRMGSMEEVCHAAFFLSENTYVTGIELNCSGGMLIQ